MGLCQCQTSDVKYQISNVNCQMTNDKWQMSNDKCQMSCKISNSKPNECQVSNGKCQMSVYGERSHWIFWVVCDLIFFKSECRLS